MEPGFLLLSGVGSSTASLGGRPGKHIAASVRGGSVTGVEALSAVPLDHPSRRQGCFREHDGAHGQHHGVVEVTFDSTDAGVSDSDPVCETSSIANYNNGRADRSLIV